jgi:serine/threonine protein kinase
MTALLKLGRIIESPNTGRRYELVSRLGEGGFAQAYRALQYNPDQEQAVGEVCLKATTDPLAWHRESYFGELLRGNRRVIQLYESFPVPSEAQQAKGLLYLTVFELAEYGALEGYLRGLQKPFGAERAKREILALLRTLHELHGGGAIHRDLTPSNVLVCTNGVLKLADFGIASHALASKQVSADAFNPYFVTKGFSEFSHRFWRPSDDVYQMGQIFAMLLLGDASRPVRLKQVTKLDCDEETRAVIRTCIGPRAKRFNDAYGMLEALEGKAEGPAGGVTSLRGKVVVFTGPLSMPRADAEVMVLQVGGEVGRQITQKTSVVVQGGRSPHYKARHKGHKLLAVEKLNKAGADIRIIGEKEFQELVKRNTKPMRAPRPLPEPKPLQKRKATEDAAPAPKKAKPASEPKAKEAPPKARRAEEKPAKKAKSQEPTRKAPKQATPKRKTTEDASAPRPAKQAKSQEPATKQKRGKTTPKGRPNAQAGRAQAGRAPAGREPAAKRRKEASAPAS